jgi:hypothetical protein
MARSSTYWRLTWLNWWSVLLQSQWTSWLASRRLVLYCHGFPKSLKCRRFGWNRGLDQIRGRHLDIWWYLYCWPWTDARMVESLLLKISENHLWFSHIFHERCRWTAPDRSENISQKFTKNMCHPSKQSRPPESSSSTSETFGSWNVLSFNRL